MFIIVTNSNRMLSYCFDNLAVYLLVIKAFRKKNSNNIKIGVYLLLCHFTIKLGLDLYSDDGKTKIMDQHLPI